MVLSSILNGSRLSGTGSEAAGNPTTHDIGVRLQAAPTPPERRTIEAARRQGSPRLLLIRRWATDKAGARQKRDPPSVHSLIYTVLIRKARVFTEPLRPA